MTQRLREATHAAHLRLESVPFLGAVQRGAVDDRDYLAYLHALSIVHGVLETLASRCTEPFVSGVWRESMRKLPLLERDIEEVERGDPGCASAPVGHALAFAKELRTWSLTEPARLVGALYVLEGATNGGRVLAPSVREALRLDGDDGVRYLTAYGDAQPEAWRAFQARLDEAPSVQQAYPGVLLGAEHTYAAVSIIAESVGDGPRLVHATALNPEAGSHRVPQDPVELDAVRRAAKACLEELPYVLERYGERGRRFTLSDGAWLATLPGFPASVVYRQVDWLARLLSALGVPRVILERHLRETQAVFAEVFPERGAEFDVLTAAADRLAVVARGALPEERRQEALQVLRSAANVPGHFEDVWLSMLADEITDAAGALDATLSWLDAEEPWGEGVAQACRRSGAVVLGRRVP